MNDAHVPLSDTILELAARADAGQKVALQTLEFVVGLAARSGLTLDISGAANAMEHPDPKLLQSLDPQARMIEVQSRKIAASILRQFVTIQRNL